MIPPAQEPATTSPLFTFETTQHALWAEEVAEEEGIPCEVVPAPPELKAKCDLALRTAPGFVDPLSEALRRLGVTFELRGGS